MNQEFTIEEFIKCLYSYHKSNLNRFKKNQTAAESKSILLPDSPSDKKKNGNSLEHPHTTRTLPNYRQCVAVRNTTVNVNLKATIKNIKVTHQILPNTVGYFQKLTVTTCHHTRKLS